MPKVNLPTKTARKAAAIKSMASIGKIFRVVCPTGHKFAEAIEASYPTAWSRLKAPEKLTLEELATASINMGITCDICLRKDDFAAELHW